MTVNYGKMKAQLKPDQPWYRISNQAGSDDEPADIVIFSEIGFWGASARSFMDELKEITATKINLRINSPGGEIFDGIAIMNALRSHPSFVTVYVVSLAASIASVIAMAGDRIVMEPNSQMMIHDGLCGLVDNADGLRRMADLLDRQSDNIAAVYAERAGGGAKAWRARMKEETWYSAAEAVAAGLADEVAKRPKREDDDDEAATNRWDLSIFNYAGRENAPTPDVPLVASAVTHQTAPAGDTAPVAICDPPADPTPAPDPAPPAPPPAAVEPPLASVALDPEVIRAALRAGIEGPFEFDPAGFRASIESAATEASPVTGAGPVTGEPEPTTPLPAPEPEPDPGPDPGELLVATLASIAAEAPAVAAPTTPDPEPEPAPQAPPPPAAVDPVRNWWADASQIFAAAVALEADRAPSPTQVIEPEPEVDSYDPWVVQKALQEASS